MVDLTKTVVADVKDWKMLMAQADAVRSASPAALNSLHRNSSPHIHLNIIRPSFLDVPSQGIQKKIPTKNLSALFCLLHHSLPDFTNLTTVT
jgi:hypothetical protein